MITLDGLSRIGETVAHGFFTRRGGVSTGLYESCNVGFGSADDRDRVARNRALCLEALGVGRLVTAYQVHSPDAVTVTEPWPPEQAPRADALVTSRPGIALGILTADCAPVLFADPVARVVGAAHAGWKGALSGIIEATVDGMVRLGARPRQIIAAIGPRISRDSYEVGPEFRDRFVAADAANVSLFRCSDRADHFRFDLGGYIAKRLAALGVGVETAPHDTLTDEENFFSYRRSVLRGEADYGRFLSAIALRE